MKFQTKILMVTLSILILTLLMNSVLSLASFEKVYVKSQISTYELICKDLKRKIERSLRFGKPLEKFKNMDKLLYDTLEDNPDINSILISSLDGDVLYHTNKQKIGSNISQMIPQFDHETVVKTLLIKDHYHSHVRIVDRTKKQVGLIKLTFSRQIIIDKLKSMANKNFNMLWILMLLTSISLVILLALVIMRPINSQVSEMKATLKWENLKPKDESTEKAVIRKDLRHYMKADSPQTNDGKLITDYLQLNKVRNEIDRLGINIEVFAGSVANSMDKLNTLYHYQDQFISACKMFQNIQTQLNKEIKSEAMQLTQDERHCIEQMHISLDKMAVLLDTMIHVADLRIDLDNESGSFKNKMAEGETL